MDGSTACSSPKSNVLLAILHSQCGKSSAKNDERFTELRRHGIAQTAPQRREMIRPKRDERFTHPATSIKCPEISELQSGQQMLWTEVGVIKARLANNNSTYSPPSRKSNLYIGTVFRRPVHPVPAANNRGLLHSIRTRRSAAFGFRTMIQTKTICLNNLR